MLCHGWVASGLKPLSLNQDDKRTALVACYRGVYVHTLESSREVKSDEVKGWQLGPLQTRLIGEDKND